MCQFRKNLMRQTALFSALLFAFVSVLPVPAADVQALRETGKGFSSVAKSAIPAVVFIRVEKDVQMGGPMGGYGYNDPYGYFGDDFLRRFFGQQYHHRRQPREFRQEGQGSGFIITKDGYILTNNHVVGDVDKIIVRLHDGREFEAELVGTDPQSEVAVIKIDVEKELPIIPLGDSEALEIGEWVIAVGNPFGLNETLTVGVVSAVGRSNVGIADYENFIQTDAAINPGNSGGPLLNIEGKAVGINTAIYSRSGGYMGIGFAIPMKMAINIKDQLIDKGRVDRGFIGISIQDVDTALARSFELDEPEGILVASVMPDSAGDEAGLQPGDIILQLNGRAVKETGSFRNDVASILPGTIIELHLLRNGKERVTEVTIGSLNGDETAVAARVDGDRLGLRVESLTGELAKQFGFDEMEGVVITAVKQGSPAARAGLQPGQVITSVNREKTTTLGEFNEALQESSDTVLLLVTDGEYSRFVALDLEE